MAKPAVPPTATDDEVRALLVRYRCPVPFHEVRTRLLGNIASPGMGVSPIKVVEGLWGGKLPEFETIDAANELVGALVMGLWNRLSRHQDRNAPFRLTRIETEATREGLAALAMLRRQELEGFVEGLFGEEEALDFPKPAHRGLGVLSEMWALFEGTEAVVRDETKTGTKQDMVKTLRLLRQMTKDAEQRFTPSCCLVSVHAAKCSRHFRPRSRPCIEGNSTGAPMSKRAISSDESTARGRGSAVDC